MCIAPPPHVALFATNRQLHFCLGRLEGHYRLLLDKDTERTETDISP